jgi:L-alanine-DL-glutamate epimerase-like enolase superfamily enzyme
MTTETPPDEVLLEAAKRSGWDFCAIQVLRETYRNFAAFTALCDLIAKHEKQPVDRKLLCAREASALAYSAMSGFREGRHDKHSAVTFALRAIELWEEGFGK